ncbi:MAG: DUF4105 domain-containing protein [Oleiphilaceae bacterium]|nr:DUF4105 domain-containing protein [Oleiphilaceae bacterium]
MRLLVIILVFLAVLLPATKSIASDLTQLANDRKWLDLLHYHQVGILSEQGSQVDDPSFFLSPDGQTNPKSELSATIEAMSTFGTDFNKYRCKYPARFTWLQSHGYLTNENLNCPELKQFLQDVSAQGLTLIFPAAYLNSPSSMFGHTLMRIDSSTHKSDLLSYSINYAANADPNDNELVFSYKGLSGGYPGVFSVLPYYEKVKEYNYLESRDVWEYELDINNQELQLFMLHVWEIKDTHFDYYFFTENCSYHLLTLLDASSTRFELSKQFSTDVIPADTVRALQEAGLIKSARFRPSMQTALKHRRNQTSYATQQFAEQLLNERNREVSELTSTSVLSDKHKAQAIELAVSIARYRAKEEPDEAAYYNKRTIRLLSERSKINVDQSFTSTPTPKTRDDQGHRSHRWLARSGHDIDGNYIGLDLRMSYHDFLDPVLGYIPGAQLEIIHAKFKSYLDKPESNAQFQLEEFRAIDIRSFSPRDNFIKPISWFVSTGLTRNIYQSDELMPYLNAGPGVSYRTPITSNIDLLSSVLLSSRAYIDSDIDKGFTIDSGPKLNWLIQTGSINFNAYWERHYSLLGANFNQQTAYLGVGVAAFSNTSLRLGVSYSESNLERHQSITKDYQTAGEIGLAWYF